MEDAFIVSARKYRPQRFDEVVGQEATTQTLKNAISSGHIAHSFLFCGPRGVGKTTIARILAKTINCKELQSDGEACNQCDSCVSFNNNSNFNIYELDAASKNSVDDIRKLNEQVTYSPQNAKYKIFIIDEVHMLSQAAFNAFLKTLEEPPEYVKFILATTEKNKILATILSRCQIYDFKRISVPDIQAQLRSIALKENIQADDKALHIIAQKADGGLRDALSMFDRLVSIHTNKLIYEEVLNHLNILDFEYYFKFVDSILKESTEDMLMLLNTVIEKGFELDTFLGGFCEHIRNLWVSKKDQTLSLLECAEDIKKKYIAQSALLETSILLNLLQILSDCENNLKHSRNKRLSVELTLLKMCYISKVMNTSWAALEDEKKNSNIVNKPVLTPTKEVKIIEIIEKKEDTPPKSNSPKGLEIGDLLNKIESKTTQKSIFVEVIEEIENPSTIWNTIKSQFVGTKAENDTISILEPKIDHDTFTFYTNSSISKALIEELFPKLKDLYFQASQKYAYWKCEIDASQSNEIVIETKKEKFNTLAEEFPILKVLNSHFSIDFYVD